MILLIINLITKDLIFNLANFIWVLSIIIGLFLFVGFVSINYLLESIADIYSITKTKDKTLIKAIKKEYDRSNKKS